jgi:hypothetical protein
MTSFQPAKGATGRRTPMLYSAKNYHPFQGLASFLLSSWGSRPKLYAAAWLRRLKADFRAMRG